MMKNIIPNFLKKLDSYLLLNAPIIWISKIHYVLFFGLLMWLFSAFIGFIIPINLFESQDLGVWYFLYTILALIALCFWIYRNVIFNVEKKFGNRHWTDEYKIFFLNFLAVFIFMSFAFPFSIIYNSRVANTVTDEELIQDINSLNEAEPFIVTDLNHYYSKYDSIKDQNYFYVNQCNLFEEYTPYFIREDSLKYNLLTYYNQVANYKKRVSNYSELTYLIQRYIKVANKYQINFNYSAEQCVDFYRNLVENSPQTTTSFIGLNGINKYDLRECIENIADAKFRGLILWKSSFLHFLFYSTFLTTLLILLFKMVQWKQFIITIITLIVLPILLFFISMILPFGYRNHTEDVFLDLVLISFGFAVFFAIKGVIHTKEFNAFKNVCLQLVYITLPIIPTLTIVFLQHHFDVFYDNHFNEATVTDSVQTLNGIDMKVLDQEAYFNSKEYLYLKLVNDNGMYLFNLYTRISFYVITFIYVAALIPFFKNLFVKQLAIPRKN